MHTVLVVDDSAVDRKLAGNLLESAPNIQVCYAEDGSQALLKIGTEFPDLVVTDLQMPKLDGLELVTSISKNYPEIPVVLMTAHGSEVIAAKALASGAASFVPKSRLGENLIETVAQILLLADNDSRFKKIVRCMMKTEFEFELENDLSIIAPIVEMIQQLSLTQRMMTKNSRVQMGVALEHALLNAMIRGNLELSREDMPVLNRNLVEDRAANSACRGRRVYFRCLVTRNKIEFLIRNEGPGFDAAGILRSPNPDFTQAGAGRGLVLIQAFMDQVKFGGGGRDLLMSKSLGGNKNYD